MAVLSPSKLAQFRKRARELHPEMLPSMWSRAQINAAFQALEDWYQANKASAAADVEAAVPGVFNNNQKKALGDAFFDVRLG